LELGVPPEVDDGEDDGVQASWVSASASYPCCRRRSPPSSQLAGASC
jgi:hypothetical protein